MECTKEDSSSQMIRSQRAPDTVDMPGNIKMFENKQLNCVVRQGWGSMVRALPPPEQEQERCLAENEQSRTT